MYFCIGQKTKANPNAEELKTENRTRKKRKIHRNRNENEKKTFLIEIECSDAKINVKGRWRRATGDGASAGQTFEDAP